MILVRVTNRISFVSSLQTWLRARACPRLVGGREREREREEGSLYHTNAINQMCAFKFHCELQETEILTSVDMNISPLCTGLRPF